MSGSEEHLLIDGLGLRVRVEGPKDAPWIVFSNSLLTDLSLWDQQVEALRGRWRVLRYDQRGHGGSAVPAVPCTLERLADDVAEIMGRLGIARAAYVGVSMGAASGLALAERHPRLIARLMLCDGPARSPPSAPSAWADRIALARSQGMPALADATLRRWLHPSAWLPDGTAPALLRPMLGATPLAGFIACASALMAYDFTAALPRLLCPTMLVAGEADGDLPAIMRDMAQAVIGGRFRQIALAGHLPNVEQPADFSACLEEMLAGW